MSYALRSMWSPNTLLRSFSLYAYIVREHQISLLGICHYSLHLNAAFSSYNMCVRKKIARVRADATLQEAVTL